jgi:cytochrome c5
MGCSFCQGHAHQVCGAPGCHDETEDVREYSQKRAAEEQARMYKRGYFDGFNGYPMASLSDQDYMGGYFDGAARK